MRGAVGLKLREEMSNHCRTAKCSVFLEFQNWLKILVCPRGAIAKYGMTRERYKVIRVWEEAC